MGYVIGIEVGTRRASAVLLDDRGNVSATARAGYSMSHPAGTRAEQSPADWEQAVVDVVRAVRAEAGIKADDITTLGLACQVDGLVALDERLNPLRPAIVWPDRRATRQSRALSRAFGDEALAARTGLNPDPSHAAPKAMWLRDAEPDLYRETRWLAPVGGHLNGWLTGEVVQDHANASSTMLYDLRRRTWCDELVAHAGLDPDLLPPIREAGSVIGTVRPKIAELLGLSPRCQVIAGTGDDQAAVLGAGVMAPGVVVDVVGPAETVAAVSTVPALDDERLVETHAHAVDRMMLVENPGCASGGSTLWWAAVQGIGHAQLFAHAGLAPPGSNGALFVPALSGSRTRRFNESMRGGFAGLALNHNSAHLARAVLEGCAYALRDIVDRFAPLDIACDEIRVVGGGPRSRLWLQIKADVTGRPVRPVRGSSATSAGVAMLAGVAAGNFADLQEAVDETVAPAEEPIMPREENSGTYADAYGAYRRLFDGIEFALA